MQSIKSIRYALFVILISNFVLYGMSGDWGTTGPAVTRGFHVPGLPTITAETQLPLDAATAQCLQEFAERFQKQESRERSTKRRKTGKEEDAGELPQPMETTTTTTTYAQPSEKRSRQASIWEESEWEDVLRSLNKRIAQEKAEVQPPSATTPNTGTTYTQTIQESSEQANVNARAVQSRFQEFLPHIESTLLRREPSLVRTIVERFFWRENSLNELNADIPESPYVTRLAVTDPWSRPITFEQIQLISRKFPNVRELNLLGVSLGDEGLRILSEQPFASRLTSLTIGGYTRTITANGIRNTMDSFTSLTSLGISDNEMVGESALAAIAAQPFAAHLTELTINSIDVSAPQIVNSMGLFTSLTRLSMGECGIGDEGLAALAGHQSLASQLTHLDISKNDITKQELENSMGAFTSLTSLNISINDIGDEGLAVLAKQSFASHLTRLEIETTKITAESLKTSMSAFVDLAHLNISDNPIRNEGLQRLAQLPCASHLVELNINHCRIKAEGLRLIMKDLNALVSLARLNISQNAIGDEGLAILAQQPFSAHLTELNVSGAGITDKGILGNIGLFVGLTMLDVSYSRKVSEESLMVMAQQPFAPYLTLNVHGTNTATYELVNKYKKKFRKLESIFG